VDLAQNAVGRGLICHVGGDRGDAEPGADRPKPVRVAGNDRHFGTMRDQRLDQSEAKAAASAG